ncbi:MAG: NAD-dependent epimerase/dehydratase family protein [Actinobacteria bacterium]|nr:NAD-dependent epimerase/dehydratase family protein [Actinomycetota bacterium]
MSDGWRILITGIAGGLAAGLARRLCAHEGVDLVVGVDTRLPVHDLDAARTVRAELSSPVVGELLQRERIDTLIHLGITSTPGDIGDRSRKEHNVIDTMQLLAAAQRAPDLRTVILKSTTAVYGSDAGSRSLFAEDTTTHADSGYARDVVEAEGYARALARRREGLVVTVLRFANLLGAGIDTPFSRYLALPVIPTVLGYDPRVQLCHTDDAVEVLRRACLDTRPGIYNVAGRGVLYLSQAVRIAGRPRVPVPMPLVDVVARAIRRTRIVDVPTDQLKFLSYGRVADITRLRERFGYEPAYSTRATLEAFLAAEGITPWVDDERLDALERHAVRLVRELVPDGRS